jgi:hypothetical protein
MSNPRFIVENQSDEPEFTRAESVDYLQVIVEDEPASALSLTAGSVQPEKCFIFETKPISRSGHE